MNIEFKNTELPDIIELKNISQSYNKGKTFVIKDLNLLIEDKPNSGQFVVILGKSGCGKSTILRYIAGLQKPTYGDILLYGRQKTEVDRAGMVFQQYSSFPWLTVLENVGLGLRLKGFSKKEIKEKSFEMIKTVGLSGHENKYAQYPILSGGQLQRVAIARSLAVNSDILLCDEPFGALDINTRLTMQNMLLGISKNLKSTIILITHDISEAVYLADQIYVMSANPGQIVKKINIDLPERNSNIKKTIQFIGFVNEIEETMLNS